MLWQLEPKDGVILWELELVRSRMSKLESEAEGSMVVVDKRN